jgi:hypothetical protein
MDIAVPAQLKEQGAGLDTDGLNGAVAAAEACDDQQLLAHAEELLSLNEDDLQGLSHDLVVAHVARYRATISRVTSRLAALGDTAVLPGAVTAAAAAPGAASGSGRPPLPPAHARARSATPTPPPAAAAAAAAAAASPQATNAAEPQNQIAQGTVTEAATWLPPSTSDALESIAPMQRQHHLQRSLLLQQQQQPHELQPPVGASAVEDDDTEEHQAVDPREWQVPPHCVPIHANVVTFNWSALISAAQFDAIVMDPPWQLATANPTRGVALGYSQLCDQDIANLPIPQVGTRLVDGLAGPL